MNGEPMEAKKKTAISAAVLAMAFAAGAGADRIAAPKKMTANTVATVQKIELLASSPGSPQLYGIDITVKAGKMSSAHQVICGAKGVPPTISNGTPIEMAKAACDALVAAGAVITKEVSGFGDFLVK